METRAEKPRDPGAENGPEIDDLTAPFFECECGRVVVIGRDRFGTVTTFDPSHAQRILIAGVMTGEARFVGDCYRRHECPFTQGRGERPGVVQMPAAAAKCRICGCTEAEACVDFDQGRACHWSGPDLCSACLGIELPKTVEEWQRLRDIANAAVLMFGAQMYGLIPRDMDIDGARALRFLKLAQDAVGEGGIGEPSR